MACGRLSVQVCRAGSAASRRLQRGFETADVVVVHGGQCQRHGGLVVVGLGLGTGLRGAGQVGGFAGIQPSLPLRVLEYIRGRGTGQQGQGEWKQAKGHESVSLSDVGAQRRGGGG
ncbi:MAG: hypothetical protein JF617_18970 [Burkholderiales bacterium]|nr:hypothetical protein [Burkholderiales bacterium]